MNEQVVDFETLVRLVLKLTGLVLMIYGALMLTSYIPGIWNSLDDFGSPMLSLSFAVPPGLLVLFGLFLWLFPKPVTNIIVLRGSGNSADEGARWTHSIELIGMRLLGLWVGYRAVSDLIYNIFFYMGRVELPPGMESSNEMVAVIAATLVELALGIVLIFGARPIRDAIHRTRYGGLGIDKRD